MGYASFKMRQVVPGLCRADVRWVMRRTGSGCAETTNPVRPKSPYWPGTGDKWAWPTPGAAPLRWPALAPENQPIGQPAPTPLPIPRDLLPYRQQSPYRVPGEQWEGGYGSWYGIDYHAPIMRLQDRRARPGETIEIRPGEDPVVVPPEHVFAPPVRGVKERKTRAGSALSRAILRAVNFTTEEVDLVDALYKAVPPDCKKAAKKVFDLRKLRQLRAQHKLQVVFYCLKVIDRNDAIREIAKNEVEDLIYGTIGQKLGKIAKKHLPGMTGFQRGPGGVGKIADGVDRHGGPVEHITDLVGDVVDILLKGK